MKKLSIVLLAFAWGLLLNAKEDWNYKNYFRTDSSYIYSWKASVNDWELSAIQFYFYGANGLLDSIYVKNPVNGKNISKSEYIYNDFGQLIALTGFTWNNAWIPSAKYTYTYIRSEQYDSIYLQIWNSNTWTNNRVQKNYKYDLEGKLLEFQMFYWRNNTWSLPTIDYSTYDENGRLIKRLAIRPGGATDYQILYNYDTYGLVTETYAQYPSGTTWANWWLISYQYNGCGQQQSQIQYTGAQTSWTPSTKTILFLSFKTNLYPGKKIPVCHNGHTIYVSKNALKAHLEHGDCVGECVNEKDQFSEKYDNKECKNIRPPFTVYPNPARDKVTIKFDSEADQNEQRRVELTDFYGKLIKSFNFKGNGDLTIYRDALLSGKYYVHLVGKEGFSTLIIFE